MASTALPPLYLVTNRHQTNNRSLTVVLREALQAGVRLIQLRERDLDTRELLSLANEVLTLTRAHDAKLLINDRVDVVKAIGADGVHLRADSLPVHETRNILGPHSLIGVSTHTPQEVRAAETDGADFAVIGPIYDTPTKRHFGPPLGLQVLEELHPQGHLPVYAIGGITPDRVSDIRRKGAYGAAVISSILESSSVYSVTQQFLEAFNKV